MGRQPYFYNEKIGDLLYVLWEELISGNKRFTFRRYNVLFTECIIDKKYLLPTSTGIGAHTRLKKSVSKVRLRQLARFQQCKGWNQIVVFQTSLIKKCRVYSKISQINHTAADSRKQSMAKERSSAWQRPWFTGPRGRSHAGVTSLKPSHALL